MPVTAAFGAMPMPPPPAVQATRIVAVVNGDVISNADVDNRARLFALSTGTAVDAGRAGSAEATDHCASSSMRRLRMQEVQRRKIVIPDKAIAEAIHDIESRNDLPAGASAAEARGGRRQPADA